MSNGIVQSKLYPPQVRPTHIQRPRLTERLTAGLAVRLTVIAAPAGFGKSSLVGQWRAEHPGVPLAWVSLDPDDNAPARFWRHVATALDQALPGAGQGALALLTSGPLPPRAVAMSLVESTVGLADDVVLVLDDFHAIANPDLHQSLLPLLEYMGSRLHLWLITRADPPLPLARLRAREELLELRADDLRFRQSEAASLLNEARGLALPADAVATLERRTEGWVTGLQLAALSLQHQPDTARFIAAFAGSHRHVADYLSEEVLAGLEPHVRAFLLQTALLNRLSGDLCNAVTGQEGGQAMLEHLERAGLFLIPLDEERRWYRYHHLFGDMLRVQARQVYGPWLAALHVRAADWCLAHGLPVEAIDHALAAGIPARAADWLETLVAAPAPPDGPTLVRLLEALPAAERTARPHLGLAYARALYLGGHYDKLMAALAAMPRPLEPHLLGQLKVAEAGAAFYRRDWAATAAICREALPLLSPDDRLSQAHALELLTAALTFRGDLEQADQASDQAIAVTAQGGNPLTLLTALSARSGIAEGRGRLRQALAVMADALERARTLRLEGMILVDQAVLLYAAGDLEGARQALVQGTEHCRSLGLMTLHFFGELRMVRVAHSSGDAAAADAHVARAAAVAAETQNPSLLAALAATKAWLALQRGDLPAATAWADSVAEPTGQEQPVLLARIRLAQGRPAAALALLEPLPDHPETLACKALALHASGDKAGAAAAAARVLPWAEAEGYRQLLAGVGAQLGALLASGPGLANSALIEPLTDREQEILQLIAAGASNQAIADRLYLAVPTVKRHVGSLLGKLGASSRTHLVAVAREKGLL